MDPTTVIATALALGAAAGFKPTAEQAIKDAYAGLKTLIKKKYSTVSVDQLEGAPESMNRRSVVVEDLAKTEAPKDVEVLQKAKDLLDAVTTHAPQTVALIGVDLERIKAASLEIRDIIGSVRVKESGIEGDMKIIGVRAVTRDESSKT